MRYLLCAALWLFAANAQAESPNIVFIIGDDQGANDYGFLGHPHLRTPHLDRLAAESLVFTQGHVPTSLCRASLATIITGLYPHQHRITSNDPPLPVDQKVANPNADPDFQRQRAEMVRIFEESPNLPKRLASLGYVSHQSGKWWEGNACRCGGFSAAMTHGDPQRGGRHGDEGLKIGRQGLKPVLEFIDRAQDDSQPFYVWYAPMMPHTPHAPPPRLLEYYQTKTESPFIARYWAMCEWFDETVGDLLSHLDERGLRDNTLIVYLHDNGWIQEPEKDGFAPKSKRSPYQGGVQTPILIRWPGHVSPRRIDTPVSSIDLVPTVLAALKQSPPENLPGINLLDERAVEGRDFVFGEIFEHNAVDIREPAKNLQSRWLRTGDWKLIVPNPMRVPHEPVAMYDLRTDPQEEQNLAEGHAELVEMMRKRMDEIWTGK